MRHTHARTTRLRLAAPLVAAAIAAPALSACSLAGGDGGADDGTPTVVLLAHESFQLPDELVEAFESEHDVELEVRQPGDAGAIVTEVALNPDDSGADVIFGVDNTLASRLLDVDAVVDFEGELPSGAEAYALDDPRLVPIDSGDVCVNVDTQWFADRGIVEPTSLDDLLDPTYDELFTTPGPVASSPGLAFLLATIAAYGEDGWQEYWQGLLDNGTEVVAGWSDAYEGSFSAGGGGGQRPIVLSYASSPAFTVTEDGSATTTRALLDACFAQTEFAGVLAGADEPELAQDLVTWLLSEDVQAALPDSMYVYPVRDDVELPEAWAEFAPLPEETLSLPADEIAANREEWIGQWRDLVE
ncbi:thiamine ABC transporter substrate-binding protein [Nocardioides zeae]|uniref:Thiamine ABC transporter substrate-binding protein n=1 Tax=Nocardioides imazamoxiresistens TaxID=3231893 RepID=A0ABU3PZW4_9ACTN|nr:thiamine ABC transporter substrate-binding protein [Nocardioides zeae]MDT9594689.1 thiamine ABC transporter substrate-binding protein [Nocardioides zeae]